MLVEPRTYMVDAHHPTNLNYVQQLYGIKDTHTHTQISCMI